MITPATVDVGAIERGGPVEIVRDRRAAVVVHRAAAAAVQEAAAEVVVAAGFGAVARRVPAEVRAALAASETAAASVANGDPPGAMCPRRVPGGW
jgi:hypothetical protein